MKRRQNKIGYHVGYPTMAGVTLVEILVVMAIIAILVTIVIGIAARIDTQGKEQLTKSTLALLDTALGEFRDYGYSYSAPPCTDLKFPLDCNNFPQNGLQIELGGLISGGTHIDEYSGSEAMYFFLSRIPDCRETLDRIDRKLVTNLDIYGNPMIITIGSGADAKVYPLFRVIDPWGMPLRYSYYDNGNETPTSEPSCTPPSSPLTFPVITSAGPDKEFGSADDIGSR